MTTSALDRATLDLLRATLDLLRDLVAVEQVAVHDRELTAAVERLAKRAQVLLEQAER